VKHLSLVISALALAGQGDLARSAPSSPSPLPSGARVSRIEYGPAKHPYCFLVDGEDLGSDAGRAVEAVKGKGVRHVRFWSHKKTMPVSECDLYSLFSRAEITVLEFRVARAFLAHPDLTRSWWPPCSSNAQ